MRPRGLALLSVLALVLGAPVSCAGVSTDCASGCADTHTMVTCVGGLLGTTSASRQTCPPEASYCVLYEQSPICAMTAQPLSDCSDGSIAGCTSYQGHLAVCLAGYPIPSDDPQESCPPACESEEGGCFNGALGGGDNGSSGGSSSSSGGWQDAGDAASGD